MDFSIGGLTGVSITSPAAANTTKFKVLEGFEGSALKTEEKTGTKNESFDSLLQSAIDMVNETNQYSNEATEAELAYAMGLTDNTHELQLAQMKANISLQYTVAVRNAVLDAYKEIMQIQF